MKMRHAPRSAGRAHRRGFTLLEILVVIAILSVMAGAAVPVASKILEARLRRATRAELEVLGEASLEYFRDTNHPPRAVSDLETDPRRKDSAGWAGPYLSVTVPDPATGRSTHGVDGWSRPFAFEPALNLAIASRGADGLRGGEDDLAIALDFTPIRRQKTLEQLRIIDQAVFLYNGRYQTAEPLPADYAAALARLVQRGFLPAAAPFARDAWGVAFTSDPEGRAPLVKVKSKSM
jgi:general secretion pathway protein G